jgi:hypothetical protein
MADTPTSRYKIRKQSLGSNTNTWGDTKLNDGIDQIDRGSKGYQSIAMTGDLTLSWSNYSTSNQGQVAVINLTGSLTSAASLIVPSVEWQWDAIINATGQTITVKTSAGTGVTIPTGYRAAVYCDGTDCYGSSPTRVFGDIYAGGQIKNVTAATASTDAVNKTQMDAAIAAATTSGTAGTLKVTSTDTTAKFLDTAIAVSAPLTKTVTSPSGNEGLALAVGALALTDGGRKTSSFSASSNTRYQVAWSADGTVTLPASPAQGDVINIAVFFSAYVTTINPNGKKINGSTSNLVMGVLSKTFTLTYDATLGDWA